MVSVDLDGPVQTWTVQTSHDDMILMETFDNIPKEEVGAFVQRCLDEGAVIVVVTRNPDGQTCTVSVERE
jgi:hypothetical protein